MKGFREAGRNTGIDYTVISKACDGKQGHLTAGGYRLATGTASDEGGIGKGVQWIGHRLN